jgi:hypothetical protein
METLDWIIKIPPEFEIFIYNKGDKVTEPHLLQKAHHIIDRPNVGRESETYIHHMLTNLKNGNGFTVFAQGDPFEHSPDFLRILSSWREWDDLQPMTWQWRADHNLPPLVLLNAYEQSLSGRSRIRPERFSLMTWNPAGFFDQGAYRTAVDYLRLNGGLPEGTNIAAHFLRLCRLNEMAERAQGHQFGIFCYGAIFAVRNELVRKLPLESKTLLHSASKGAINYGYILERMWLHLFGAEFSLAVLPNTPMEETRATDGQVVSIHPRKAERVWAAPADSTVTSGPPATAQGMTDAEKVAVTRMIKSLGDRINDRDYFMISDAWRYHGGDAAILDFCRVRSKSPMIWAEAKPEFWLIYLCILLENGEPGPAREILNKYCFAHGTKLIENYLPIVQFSLEHGVDSDKLRKASRVRDCLIRNQEGNLLERLLKGKSVALVGNGPSELGKGRGAEIDGHDIVIRFNNYVTRDFEDDYGCKTDVWVRGSGGNDIVDRTDADQYKLIMWEADYEHFPIHFNDLDILHRYLERDREKCAYFDFATHFSLREACGISFPSTGLVAFWKIYNLLGGVIDSVRVYGFAFLEENPVFIHPHYFQTRDIADAKSRSEVHRPALEAQFMRGLIRALEEGAASKATKIA